MSIRIYEVARELNLEGKTVIALCNSVGLTSKKSALQTVTTGEYQKIKNYLVSHPLQANKEDCPENSDANETGQSEIQETTIRQDDSIPQELVLPTIVVNTGSIFRGNVLQVLEARGITSEKSEIEFFTELLNDNAQCWLARIERPITGETISVTLHPERPTRIGNSTVRLDGIPDLQGEQTVRILQNFGQNSRCELWYPPDWYTAKKTCEMETHPLLAISSRNVTALFDVLPGFDCLTLIEIWSNETVPLNLLTMRRRSGKNKALTFSGFVRLLRDEITFATECFACQGLGWRDCNNCTGSGSAPCRQCDNDGCLPCAKCNGSGILPETTCKMCNGSGSFVGRQGNTLSCGPCDGTGIWKQRDCSRCDGRGFSDCPTCNGSKNAPCGRCRGTGKHECGRCNKTPGLSWANFNPRSGCYTSSGPKKELGIVSPEQVRLIDWNSGSDVAVSSGAAEFIDFIATENAGTLLCDPQLEQAIADHIRGFSLIRDCLDKSLETEDILELKRIQIGQPEAALRRSKHAVVYDFPVILPKKSNWKHEGMLPFPIKSQLKFKSVTGNNLSDYKLPFQAKENISKITPSLVGCTGKNSDYRLSIRLPRQIDISQLPQSLFIERDAPPPSQKTEKEHLRQWCDPGNRDHPILRGLFDSNLANNESDPIELFNSEIAGFPSQVEAVQLALSPGALGMIKGPPGTGKTTVITEIVRQFIARGKKVLVCSQTHQAVQNVLEKLHRVGNVRMVRHGHEDNLSDIELSYKHGSVQDRYHLKVLKHCTEKKQALEDHIRILRAAQKELPNAFAAANRLKTERSSAKTQLSKTKGRSNKATKHATSLLETHIAVAQQLEEQHLHENATSQNKAKTEQARILAKIRKAEASQTNSSKKVQKRTGSKPKLTTTSPSFLSKIIDPLIPEFVATNTRLQHRFTKATTSLKDLRPTHLALCKTIDTIHREERVIRKQRCDTVTVVQDSHSTRQDVIKRWLNAENKVINRQLKKEEKLQRQIQAKSVALLPSPEYELSDDMLPDEWQGTLDRVEADLSSSSARLDFISSWLGDIESEPNVIRDCYWDRLQVFFSTCVGLGSWRDFKEHHSASVDLVIIDEAAHATASETIMPLLNGKKALLIGDEMQLPPLKPQNLGACGEDCSQFLQESLSHNSKPQIGIANEIQASDCWLGYSLFEWIWHTQSNVPRVMLDTQFRMHPSIANFVGEMFYEGRLDTAVKPKDRLLGFSEFNKPVCLISTSAYADRFEDFLDPGYRNNLEARMVKRIIERAEKELDEIQEFGIITPYAKQKREIEIQLHDIRFDLKKVDLTEDDIASVDSFQGSERDVIIISFVRSPKKCKACNGNGKRKGQRCNKCRGKGWLGTGLTFVRDLRRLNVAFSRARKMLILIGDIQSLIDQKYRGGLSGGRVLEKFSKYIADKGKVLHLWENTNVS